MSKLFMDETKIEQLLALARPSARDYALFHVALATGFRASDLINLGRDDVAPHGAVIRYLKIKMQKTGKTVERELGPACREALYRYLSTRVDYNPYLFRSESNNTQNHNGPMHRTSLIDIFKSYLRQLFPEDVLKGNACHVTRRSVAKIISDKAGRIEPATRFLGHTSVANTVQYLDMDGYGKQANEIVHSLPWS